MKLPATLSTLLPGLLALLAALHAADAPKRKPSIVLILADDQGFGDVCCCGTTKVKTPNIDKGGDGEGDSTPNSREQRKKRREGAAKSTNE